MIVTLESGDTVEIASVTQLREMTYAHGACSGMHDWMSQDCAICGLFVLGPSGHWRRMTDSEKSWLKHKDDWMRAQ